LPESVGEPFRDGRTLLFNGLARIGLKYERQKEGWARPVVPFDGE
jgi:hypothetical protein